MNSKTVKKSELNRIKEFIKKARNAEKAFFTSFDSSPVAKSLLEPESGIYYDVNREFLKLLECSKKNVTGKTASDLGFLINNEESRKILKKYSRNKYSTFNFDINTYKGNKLNVIISTDKIKIFNKNFILGHILDNTEKKLITESLFESKHNYEVLLKNTQNAVYEYSIKENRYKYITPSSESLLGISPQKFLKKKNNLISPLINKQDKERFNAHFKRIFSKRSEGRKHFSIEYKFTNRNKSTKWLLDSHTVIYDKNGRADTIIGNITDISENKFSQEKIIEGYDIQNKYLEQLSAIQDSIPANIALIDQKGTIIAVNNSWKSFAENNGLKDSNYSIGKNYLTECRRSRNKDSAEALKGIQKVLTGRSREFHMEYDCHSENELRWYRFTVNPIAVGHKSGAVLMHINITDQKLAEIKILENEQQYRLLFNNNPLPMWIFDFESTKFLAVNNAALEHYGYTREEFLKLTLLDIRPENTFRKFRKYRKEIILNNQKDTARNAGIWKHQKKNGEIIDVEITRTPVNFEGKNAVLVLAHDVTEKLKAENSLIRRNSEINTLYAAGKELSKTLEPEKIYNKIYNIIREMMPCDSMLITDYDENSGLLSCRSAWIGRKKLDITKFPSVPVNLSGSGIQSRVIKTGRSELLNDFQNHVKRTGKRFYYKPDGTIKEKPNEKTSFEKCAIIVPLKIKDKVTGVLQVKSLKENVYTENDLHLVESLAAQITAVTLNAKLYQQAQEEIKVRNEAERKLKKLAEEIKSLYEISRDVSKMHTPGQIYSKVFKIIHASAPECDIGISIYNEKEKNIILKGLFTDGAEIETSSFPVVKLDESGTGLQSSVILNKKTRVIYDYKDYIRNHGAKFYVTQKGKISFKKRDLKEIANSTLIVPLIFQEKVTGTLQLLNFGLTSFSEQFISMIETLASHIAVSINNASLYNKLQNELTVRKSAEQALLEKTRELEILYESQKLLSGSLYIENIYDKIFEILNSNISFHSMIISAYNETEKNFKVLSLWADSKKQPVDNIPVIPLAPKGKGIQSEVIRNGKSVLINDYLEHYNRSVTHYQITDNRIDEQSKVMYNSALISPMIRENRIIGTIQLLSHKKNAYNESDQNLLESLCGPISAATYNASLYRKANNEIAEKQKAREELALRNREITLLYSAGREMLSTLDLKEVYEIYYRKVKEVINCDSLIISEYQSSKQQIICKAAWVEDTKHDPDKFPPLKTGPNYKGTQSEAIITGNSLIVNNFSEIIKDRNDKYLLDNEGNVINYAENKELLDDNAPVVNSAMYIPMKIGNNVIGVVSVFSFDKNAYTDYDLKILESITVHVTVAAANAELYKRAQTELSERIKKEEELKQIRKNLEEAQRIAHIGSWVYDITAGKIYNSDELYRILGIKEIPPFFEFSEGMGYIHDEDRQKTIDKITAAIKSRNSYENEDRIIRPDGEIRYVKIVGEPMYNENGEFAGMHGTLQDITEIKRINEELIKSLNEKELILKEIHHRVKNNLQVVSSLLRLQSESIKDESAIGYLKMSEQRVKSMALIHQQLYRTKDLSRIDFREYLEDLCNYLFFAYDISFSRIELKIEVDNIYFGIDTALPCGLIVNELVTNSIKHAFPDYSVGTLMLSLKKEISGRYILRIKDDGKGGEKIDFEKANTLGMELVKTLTEQLEGEIKVNCDKGTEIIISFFDQNTEN